MGAAAMVARRIGEGDAARASAAAVQAILGGGAISLALGGARIVFARDLLVLLGASPALAATERNFTAILLGRNTSVLLLFLINGIFRGAGDPARAMRARWLANLLNLVLDPILIFGLGPVPALGLEGAAIATTFSRAVGVVYQLRQLADPRGRVVVRWRQARLNMSVLTRLMRVSGIGIVQYLVGTASFLGLIRILAPFGDTVLAGYTVAIRIIIFVLLPAWGIGNAAATLVGQNLGAGKPDRAERAVWFTAQCNTVFLGLVGLFFCRVCEPDRRSADDRPRRGRGRRGGAPRHLLQLRWGFGLVTVVAFNGEGDTSTPTWINFLVYWVVQLPLAGVLAIGLGLGPMKVFATVAVCQTLLAAVGVAAFRRATWKTRTI